MLNAIDLGAARLEIGGAENLTVTGNVTATGITLAAIASLIVNSGVTIHAGTGNLILAVNAAVSFDWLAVTPVFRDREAAGRLEIGAATLRGHDITIAVDATSTRFADFEIDELNIGAVTDALTPALAEGTLIQFTDNGVDPDTNAPMPDTIFRNGGNWFDDGFAADGWIQVLGSVSNDGFFRIASMTIDTLTLDIAAELITENSNSEVQIEGVVVMTGNPQLTLGVNSVERLDLRTWAEDGFKVGQTVVITGTPDGADADTNGDNDGSFAIMEITGQTMVARRRRRTGRADRRQRRVRLRPGRLAGRHPARRGRPRRQAEPSRRPADVRRVDDHPR